MYKYAVIWLAVLSVMSLPVYAGGQSVLSDLVGTQWQLVKIMYMNDTEAVPEESSLYTIAFEEEGKVSIRADCNRATGSWSSSAPSRLTFGPIASTRAMCGPDSLDTIFLKEFEWVRGYVLEEGRLFLSTMADGAIIEFEAVGPKD